MKVCVFSERLQQPWDEGIKNVAAHLIAALNAEHEVLALTSKGADDPSGRIYNVSANRLLWSGELNRRIRAFGPDAIVYIPTACATLFSFIRARVLAHYASGRPVVLAALQPRVYPSWQVPLMPRLAPDWVLVQSERTAVQLRRLGCRVGLLPPAVDCVRFRAASAEEKTALRSRYGIPSDVTVVLHVGHLKSKRNVSRLCAIGRRPGYHALIVGSTSTLQDQALKNELHGQGVTVVDSYVERIEDMYRLSDVYAFLCADPTAAIDMPLSVLEAMACNLAVVSTPFGGLPDFFPARGGLSYVHDVDHLRQAIVASLIVSPIATRALVERYTWPAAARAIIEHLQD